MDNMAGSQLAAVEDYLLPSGHPELVSTHRVSAYNFLRSRGHTLAALVLSGGIHYTETRPKQDLQQDWHAEHIARCLARKVHWWNYDLSPEIVICFPGITQLTDRELDSLTVSGIQIPEGEFCAVEVSQSSGCRRSADHYHAIIPRTRQYLARECRIISGVECLFVQNIRYPREELLFGFPDALLRNLAGNAFEASCCLASVVAASVAMSFGCSNMAPQKHICSASIGGRH
jgi:hypothetical protein